MNPELRAVLTEALAGHQPENYGFNCSGCDWEPANPAVTDAAEFAAHQLDALDTAPGVAVIQLPEPYFVHSATDDVNGYADWEYPHGSIATTDDGTIMWGKWHITDPEKVRAAAAALLAAAAAAVVAAGEEA
ncbi:hypothetical protein CL86_gp069 [Mycobacterium phage SkiPole]|uniref:Uncharacterized protein n=1 Tax=Mycobacterium phage SkiPole TaxID=701456 RepID=D2XRR3_9CAUD|nr:hypothetical protein CL86_gp069 [Mycobacterium phage SkiPole]ADA83791.1 hypothetical protein SKIPOLE_69 [Mycobacterium phage SkiPole]AXH68082.1 hypothetical protein SEA_TARGET_63 [Mycobacterium phage Target]